MLLVAGGLALQFVLRPALAGVGLAYLVLTCSYTLWWRSVAVADIAAVSGGFVLRALAGGVAVDVAVSRWFLAVTSFGALFLVAGKRYAELRSYEERYGESPGAPRPGAGRRVPAVRASLGEYSQRYLRFVIALSATAATTAYCLWAFQRSHQARVSWYELTGDPVRAVAAALRAADRPRRGRIA